MNTPESPQPPLVKDVPGSLFSFEEKVFGLLSLTHLLYDFGAGATLLAVTASLPLLPRLVLAGLLAFPILLLVHGKIQGRPLVSWLILWVRFLTVPRVTIWQDPLLDTPEKQGATSRRNAHRRRVPSTQTTWIHLDSLHHGIAGNNPNGRKSGGVGRFWAVFEVEGRAIDYLPALEQVRLYRRFETFLTGLEFRLQWLSRTDQVHPQAYPPLRAQEEALQRLQATPRLAEMQKMILAYQQKQFPYCTITRHFVVVSVSAQDEALRQAQEDSQGLLTSFLRLLTRKSTAPIPQEQVLDQLRIRSSVVKRLFQQLDVRARLLDDAEALQVFAGTLALGAEIPSFVPQRETDHASWSLRGLHTTLSSERAEDGQNRHAGGLLRAAAFSLADLLAPSSVQVEADHLRITTHDQRRYQRYFRVVGYGHQVTSGWVSELADLGLPLVISTQFEPLDARFMLQKLERQLVKIESKRLADLKTSRLPHAEHTLEGEQVRRLAQALASHRLKLFFVTMTIGVHASSQEHLDQRSRYLLSHLRQKQLQVYPATRQHDQAWQQSLPTNDLFPLSSWDGAVTLPSDVCSTFLNCHTGMIGTPEGVFLGFTGSGVSRRPVYIHPWLAVLFTANPHMVVIGDTGYGKSWVGKTLAVGFMGMGIADVVVLDRDDDYLPLHMWLGDESQRYDLARRCPINFFDLPYSPADVDPADPADLLSEFLDHHLMVALALIIVDTEQGITSLSKREEAYLMQVGRAVYAAKGITSEAIRHHPETLLLPAPTLADFVAMMKEIPASSEEMRLSLQERLEKALYLFPGKTTISITKPLTVFSIHDLDEKWYPLMTFVVQNFLSRHRALRRDERYLAYIVEEASYMLKHPAGRRYLENGSRGFRKLGIAQITLSQHPRDFLEEGAVILSNAGTAFFLGMQREAAEKLGLSPELERVLTDAVPGQAVMRCGNTYASITIASNPKLRTLFTTDPREGKQIRQRAQQRQQSARAASFPDGLASSHE